MTKETEDRMCLQKRHNDKRDRRYNDKGNERQNVLIERHNDKRAEDIMTKETGEGEDRVTG